MGRSSRSTSPDEFPLLAELGLKATSIRGDGNCLFNALSDQIYGDQSYSTKIRATVIEHMRANADDFKAFVPVEPGLGFRRNPKRKNVASSTLDTAPITRKQIEQNWENYLTRMAQNGTFGDNLEIRAFSKAYNTDVRIYNRANNFMSRVATDGVVRRTAHIALHTWEHYSSVRNINGPDIGLPNIHIDIERTDFPASTPSTPGSSFTSSAASSVERDLDSDEERVIYGPKKKARSPNSTRPHNTVADADIPTISLTEALDEKPAQKPVPKIILKLNSQHRKEEPNLRRRNLTAAQSKQLKKQEQKKAAKQRKKEAALSARQPAPTSDYKASLALQPVSGGMRTLTI